MTAFNELNGIPASAHPLTLDTILRKEWAFDGLVVSDWTSITEMIAHGYAADPAHAAQLSLSLGVDMDMCSFSYRDHGKALLAAGRIRQEHIDNAVRRVLAAKFALGLFDNPYADVEREKKVTLSPEHRAVARKIAARSLVLLKNDADLLPLAKSGKRIALIGPLAESRKDPLGTWAGIGKPEDVITIAEGLQKALGDSQKLTVVAGSAVREPIAGGVEAAVAAAKDADLVILAIGESEDMSGEGHSRADIGLPTPQQTLAEAVVAAGKPVAVVLLCGRPMTIPWLAEHAPAIVVAWHPGVECGNAIADVLLGEIDPSGKLPATFPRHVGQVPIYYNHKNTGRPPTDQRYTSKYIDIPVTPQYPFGHGLSYTRFAFGPATISPAQIPPSGTVEVSFDVKNAGARAGDETVQLYIHDPVASLGRPVRELKGFQRVELAAGGSQRVTFRLTQAELGFFDNEGRYIVEPGEIRVFAGADSTAPQVGKFEIVAP
jgi:beta-glucosidase